MQNQWIAGVVLAGLMFFCPAVASTEESSAKLLEAAKAKVSHIERLISSAKAGDAESQYKLARMIFEKSESSRSVDEAALTWFRRAAQQGHLGAQWEVCEMYRRLAVNRYTPNEDKEKGFSERAKKYKIHALAWDRVLVRSKGDETIEFYNDRKYIRSELLSSRMTDDEVAEAERLSREFEREIKRKSRKGESSK
jgi:TPR repeat protein